MNLTYWDDAKKREGQEEGSRGGFNEWEKREAQTPSNGYHCNLWVPINLQLIVRLSLRFKKRQQERVGGQMKAKDRSYKVKQRDRKHTFHTVFCVGQACEDYCGPWCGLYFGVF